MTDDTSPLDLSAGTDEPDGVFEQIGEAIDRVGVPLGPLVASFGWFGTLVGTVVVSAGGGAGLIIGGLGAACAAAAAGKRYRRPGGARLPGAGRPRGTSMLGSAGSSGGRRSGGLLAGAGGRRSGASTGGGRSGGRAGGLPGIGRSSSGRAGAGRGSLLGGRRAGTGGGTSGSGSRGGALGRLGLVRRTGSGAGASTGGRPSAGGRAGRIRSMLGRAGRPTVGSSAGGRTPAMKGRRITKPPTVGTPGGPKVPVTRRARLMRRLKASWPPPPPHPNAEPRFGPKPTADRLKKKPAGKVAATVQDPAKTPPTKTTARPPVPAAAAAPTRTTNPTRPNGGVAPRGGTMSKLRLVDLSNDMAASVANIGVEAGEMYDFLVELEHALPTANENLAQMWRNLRDKMAGEMPLKPAVVEFIDSLVYAQTVIGQMSAEFPRLIRVVHADDMGRHENPRPGEKAWNVA